ncbi:MAG: hypothetical protein JXB47_02300 [Anaerolineae bacterium]|nr:hypothetical protein [Anaerolineae bacterium]
MSEVDQIVKQGIKAFKAGKRQEARALLEQALGQDERHEMAWLWMSAVVEKPEEQEICLENVLAINPDNQNAQKGLETVRKRLAASAPRPAPPEPASSPPAARPDPPAQEAEFEFFSQAQPSSALVEAGGNEAAIFAKAKAKKKDRSLLVGSVGEFEGAPQRGILQLFDAWIAALTFNRRDAYAAELPVATIGRTMIGVVLSTIIATLVLGVGFVIGLSKIMPWIYGVAGQALPLPEAFMLESTSMALQMTVISAPFLVIFFFALAFAMHLAAKVFGSKTSFYDNTHIFSVAYSPTIIILAFLVTIQIILMTTMLGQVNVNWDIDYWTQEELAALQSASDRFDSIFSLLGGVYTLFQLYAMAVWSHALGVVHGSGTIMGCITVIGGTILSVVCVFPATCCLLSNLMSL